MSSPTIDRRLGLAGNVGLKAPATVIATGNITLSGQQTIDGVGVLALNAAGIPDRVLCVGQTNAVENGLWDVSTGSWSRTLDANGNYDFAQGTMVLVARGTTYAGTVWKLSTAAPITIGTSSLTWTRSLTSDMSSLSFIQRGSGAVTRGAQEKMRDFISILDFIPETEHAAILAGTSTYDCATALANAIASVSMPGLGLILLTGGPEIYFPPGVYKINSTVHVKKRITLRGVYGGTAGAWGTVLQFPGDTGGFVFHRHNTDETGTVAPSTNPGADGTMLADLNLYGTSSAGVNANAHGVWARCRITMMNVEVGSFHGDGIHIEATAGGGGFAEGNANNFYIANCSGRACGGTGLFTDGADVNAGTVVNFNGEINGGWGIWDSSFLGNTYIACHTATNTLGAYKTDNVNARNLFLGCYSESGQPASSIVIPSMVIGGLHGAGVTGGAPFIDVDIAGMNLTGVFQMATAILGYGQADTTGTGMQFKDTGGVSNWTFEKTAGRWGWKWAAAGTPGFVTFYDQTATTTNGYARSMTAVNGGLGIGDYYFGTPSQMCLRGLGNPPTSTSVFSNVGDAYETTAPTSGGFIGRVCVTPGVGGVAVWRAYGLISTST